MGSSHGEEERLSLLYEASHRGSVSTLNSLVQKEPLILHKISQSGFAETPLHLSALLGHLEFTKALLTYKPKLAIEVDSSQNTPLHLASAEGHIDIVKELLKVNNKPCLFPNQEGKIPLHFAVMRGRTEVVTELVKAKPESLSFFDDGNTVFHMCVIYNHLETLKGLVELELAISGKLLNLTSSDGVGNTVFHLAVSSKHVETIRYLLSIPNVKEMAGLKNDMGLTAYDILKCSSKDFKSLEIQLLLTEYFGIRTDEESRIHTHTHSSPPVARPQIQKKKKRNCFIKILKWIGGWFKQKGDWIEEMRGNLSLVSTVIATITFQSLVNPPGGFIQQGLLDDDQPSDALNCTILNNKSYCPGEAVASFPSQNFFLGYLICNTISFISSLSVTLLLVSGVPMKNKALIWLLSIGMCITLTALALVYITAIAMVTPTHLLRDNKAGLITLIAPVLVWSALLLLIVVLITLRLIIWIVKKCVRAIKKAIHMWNYYAKLTLFLYISHFNLLMLSSGRSQAAWVAFKIDVILGLSFSSCNNNSVLSFYFVIKLF